MKYLLSDLLEIPFLIVERTNLSCFEPPRNTMKMKRVITVSPSNIAFLSGRRLGIRLTFNAKKV